MVQQASSVIENNFTKGLVTEFTGLNFPVNAATECDNCAFTLVGDVLRREGIDAEPNFTGISVPTGSAKNEYTWSNAGGDGLTKILVRQNSNTLYFYRISTSTNSSPLSQQLLPSTVILSSFVVAGGSLDTTKECQFSDGNGYLFVTHPSCDPFYCTYSSGIITGNRITVQIRDFLGVPEAGVPANTRPTALTIEHNYNLINQGWVSGNPWSTVSSSNITVGLGSKTFTVSAGLTVTLGDQVTIIANHATASLPVTGPMMSGNVTAYAGTTMTINVTSGSTGWFGTLSNDWLIVPRDTAYISNWFSALGNYPSNSDVWWYFKNTSGVFDPSTTLANVSLSSGNAPKGHFLLDAFSQQRDLASNLVITDISTNVRPRLTTWFQGRVWYAGVDAQQAPTGDAGFYTWTENLYFSQVVSSPTDFGSCYQVNDPTSQTLFDLLPTDGGVIQIQGCGSTNKLFPVQNGLLVFAGNGIWFIAGSQGIGFSANDYTITKISSIQTSSSTSFVNVLGLPYFWNEDNIYTVQPTQGGGMNVEPITVGTILSFYEEIPFASKQYVRGAYNPIDYVIQWVYRSTKETGVSDRYSFDKILSYNTYNKAFYPYTVSPGASINGVSYINYPQITTNTPDPTFKYSITYNTNNISFAEMYDTSYVDWASILPSDYISYFITGFRLAGQALNRFQVPYIYTFSRNDFPNSFYIQGLWDFATSSNSGRWSTPQLVNNNAPQYGTMFRRHRIRGRGLVLQLKVKSVPGQPFDIMGWSMPIQVNASV